MLQEHNLLIKQLSRKLTTNLAHSLQAQGPPAINIATEITHQSITNQGLDL